MTVCIPISCISRGRQRHCPQRPVIPTQEQQGSHDRHHVPGMELGPPWPCAGTGMAAWGVGVGTVCVTSNLSLWASEPTCRNVCWCEGGKTEVAVRIRFEHGGDGAFKESISTQQNTLGCAHFGINQVLLPWLRVRYKLFMFFWIKPMLWNFFSESSQCFANLKSGKSKPVLLYFSYLFPEACWQNFALHRYKRTLGQNYLNREL